MRPKAIFLAQSVQQAYFWIRQWGWSRQDCPIITRLEEVHGWHQDPDDPISVFICGSEPSRPREMWEMMGQLLTSGFDIIDAQEIDEYERGTHWAWRIRQIDGVVRV